MAVNKDITFEYSMLCCVRCDIGFISSSLHKCWIAVARVIVFVYGPVCIYVHSCHIKAAVLGWGECGGALKDILMTTVCEGWASPGLPPTGPLDYFAISPHALAESLGDIRASISHTAALTLPPATTPLCFASPLALQISFCRVQVCVCVHAHILFSLVFFLEAN